MSLHYTNKSSVRSSTTSNDCYAVDLTLNSTNTHLAVLTVPTSIQLFDASTLQYVTSLSSTSNNVDRHQHGSSAMAITCIQYAAVSPHTLFASTDKNIALIWDTRTPQDEALRLNGSDDRQKFLSIACNNDDLLVAAGSELKGGENASIAFWDLRLPTDEQVQPYYTESHSDDIIHVEFCRMNSKRFLSGSTDGLVCLYDLSKTTEDDALEQVIIETKSTKTNQINTDCLHSRSTMVMDQLVNVALHNTILSMQ
jgi:WD repeat-containing protein 89